MRRHSIITKRETEFQNITQLIRGEIRNSGVKDGICVVYVPHTTAGVTINENADPSVVEDIISYTCKYVPDSPNYKHMEGNSPAHVKASLFGTSQTLIISSGDIQLGTWQGIFFCEFDGPRNRNVYLKIIPG